MMGFDLILIAASIAYILRWRSQINQTGPTSTSQTLIEILKARYARGEITREQYESMKPDIG
jgi:uncharacterized membrane protein